MLTLLSFLFLFALIFWGIGLVKPSLFSKWFESSVNRKKVSLIFGGASLVLFIVIAIIPSPGKTKPEFVKFEMVTPTDPNQQIYSDMFQGALARIVVSYF